MDRPGYERFVLLVEGMQKSIQRIKLSEAPGLGIKGVHIFWLEHLRTHPEGLMAAELASKSMVDRSLISREIAALERGGYVKLLEDGRRYVLTEDGLRLSDEIVKKATEVQSAVNEGISKEELEAFYRTFEKLRDNFEKISDKPRKRSARANKKG